MLQARPGVGMRQLSDLFRSTEMRFIGLALVMTIGMGCGAKHELILANRSGGELRSVEVRLGEDRFEVGNIPHDRVIRASWRGDTYEQPYEFWARQGVSEIRLGSCGYPSDPIPGAVIAHLVVFEPESGIYCGGSCRSPDRGGSPRVRLSSRHRLPEIGRHVLLEQRRTPFADRAAVVPRQCGPCSRRLG
jgi:hypothetical protein